MATGEILVPRSPDAREPGATSAQTVEHGVTFALAETVVMSSDPSGLAAESLRVLRTHLLTQHVREGRRGMAVCSPTPGVGCTTVAVNLAVALAQAGVRTLLIDGDLRRPAVHKFVMPSREVPGLQQCLTGPTVALADAIQDEVLPNLSVLYAGGRSHQAQELLSSARFRDLANSCMRDYDLTIIDTPPANSSADARQVSSVFSYALLVVGRNRTFVADVKTLAEELQADHARIVGVALRDS